MYLPSGPPKDSSLQLDQTLGQDSYHRLCSQTETQTQVWGFTYHLSSFAFKTIHILFQVIKIYVAMSLTLLGCMYVSMRMYLRNVIHRERREAVMPQTQYREH